MKAKRVDGFKILTDDIDEEQLFESREEALESINIEEVTMYECGECEEKYDDRDEAKECCKE